MLKKISRKAFLTSYPEFIQASHYRNKYIAPDIFDSYILYVNGKSTVSLCNNLSKEVARLIKLLGYQDLSFLGDITVPWLYSNHEYKPVKRGLDYLASNKISKSFNGAIQVDVSNLSDFMKHLFWLVRCNGVIAYVNFSDADFNIMASVCQYGNLHLSTLNEETDLRFNTILNQTGLYVLPDANCGGTRIPGRASTITV